MEKWFIKKISANKLKRIRFSLIVIALCFVLLNVLNLILSAVPVYSAPGVIFNSVAIVSVLIMVIALVGAYLISRHFSKTEKMMRTELINLEKAIEKLKGKNGE